MRLLVEPFSPLGSTRGGHTDVPCFEERGRRRQPDEGRGSRWRIDGAQRIYCFCFTAPPDPSPRPCPQRGEGDDGRGDNRTKSMRRSRSVPLARFCS